LTIPVPTVRLALPAPVLDLTMLAVDALAAKLATQKAVHYAPLVPPLVQSARDGSVTPA
jgi:hypothetical protein